MDGSLCSDPCLTHSSEGMHTWIHHSKINSALSEIFEEKDYPEAKSYYCEILENLKVFFK